MTLKCFIIFLNPWYSANNGIILPIKLKSKHLHTRSHSQTWSLFASGGWSGDSVGYRALLGHDAVPVCHPSPDAVLDPAFLPREPSLPAHKPGRGEQGRGWWVVLAGVFAWLSTLFPFWTLSWSYIRYVHQGNGLTERERERACVWIKTWTCF